jgi:hypothetical protein
VWETADELSMPRHHRAEPARPRARQPRALARVAARRLRPHRHPDPAADRRGEGFAGVVDLVAMKACMFANDGSGKPVDGAIPAT